MTRPGSPLPASPPASPGRHARPRAVVAGGGIAALEAVLALDEIAGSRLDVALIAADARFHYVPLSVAEPFHGGRAYRLDLADVLGSRGVEVELGRVEGVDAARRLLRTADGREIPYDALLVAVGAARRNVLPGAVAFRGWQAPVELRRLLRRAAAGQVRRIAFAVPAGVTWTLPAYELALMTAAHFEREGIAADVSLATHEPRPLDVLGDGASEAIGELLRSRRVAFHGATPVRVRPGRLVVEGGEAVPADAVVALPRSTGPGIAGLPRGDRGFVPVDEHCRVPGAERVYAAGDVTSFPLEQGGIAAQQAGAAAEAIAADLGLGPAPRPFEPQLRALLLAGSPPRHRRVELGRSPAAAAGAAADGVDAIRWPAPKVAGHRLARLLALHGVPPGVPPGTVALDLVRVRPWTPSRSPSSLPTTTSSSAAD